MPAILAEKPEQINNQAYQIASFIILDQLENSILEVTPLKSLVLNIFYSLQEGVNGFIRENYTFPRIQRWPNFFQGGPASSREGVQMLISIESHITCDFTGGSGPPISPSGSANEPVIFHGGRSRPPIPLWICT